MTYAYPPIPLIPKVLRKFEEDTDMVITLPAICLRLSQGVDAVIDTSTENLTSSVRLNMSTQQELLTFQTSLSHLTAQLLRDHILQMP